MYQTTIVLIETDSSENMPIIRNLFMAAVVVAGTMGLIYFRLHTKKHPLKLARYNGEMSFIQLNYQALKIFPFSTVAMLCVLCAIMWVLV